VTTNILSLKLVVNEGFSYNVIINELFFLTKVNTILKNV